MSAARNLDEVLRYARPKYSICTLVTRPDEYAEMCASFRAHGFREPDCEFLYADNSRGNRYDGFSGCNAFLRAARGQFIILCHQDILLIDDVEALDARLDEVTEIDPLWAACGNAGCSPAGDLVIRITDPNGKDTRRGQFPSRVLGLDENFVVVRAEANLGVSPHLSGFHLYAAELCAAAASLGMKSYAIDFHVLHKSGGNRDKAFFVARSEIRRQRSAYLRPSIIAGATTSIFISGLPPLDWAMNLLLRVRRSRPLFRLVDALHTRPPRRRRWP